MGRWPHCQNGHGPLEVEKDEQTELATRYYCPDCDYELDKEWVKKQRERYPPVK